VPQSQPEPEPVQESRFVPETRSVPEPRSYEPAAEPAPATAPRPRAEEPRIDAKQILDDSGLVMVETDRAKVQVQPQVVQEPAQPAGRPRRERPKPPQPEELVQVETTTRK
jgi:hypothetical protein